MIETIFLATVIPMVYTGVGVGIFRKIYYKVKSEYYADYSRRMEWEREDGGWWVFGCMAGALLWPVAGFFVGLYYSIVSKHTTPWEKEEQLKELRKKNDEMERELKIGKYAPKADGTITSGHFNARSSMSNGYR
jgi:hypothetical protein